MDFHEIFINEYFFRKSVEKMQVSLKSDFNNRYYTLGLTEICDTISLNSSYNEKQYGQNLQIKSKHFMFNNVLSRIALFMR